MVEIINNGSLTDEQLYEIEEGASFLTNWLETRRKREGEIRRPDGKTKTENAIQKIDNAIIFASDEGCLTQMYNALSSGQIHFKPEILQKLGLEKALEDLQNLIQNNEANTQNALGPSWSEYIEGPAIFASNEGILTPMHDALASGQIHLKPEILEKLGLEKALENLQNLIRNNEANNQNALGFSWREYIEEPAIFINTQNIQNLSEKETGVSLSSVITHELTHIAELTSSESYIAHLSQTNYSSPKKERINEDYISLTSHYDDQPNEIYARLMEFRNNMNIEPNHVFTLEEVQQLRRECDERRRDKKNDTLSPDDFHKTDYKLFDRFTDEDILKMLNMLAYEENYLQINNPLNLDITQNPLRNEL